MICQSPTAFNQKFILIGKIGGATSKDAMVNSEMIFFHRIWDIS